MLQRCCDKSVFRELKLPLVYKKPPIKCGSWLACDGGVSVTTAIAGKPAPTLIAFQIQ
jgi:hypothetical protein